MSKIRYEYGTAARKYPQPVLEDDRVILERQKNRRQEKKKRSVLNGVISIAYLAAVSFTVLNCFQYLQLQAESTVLGESIASIESSITELKVQNDAIEYEINGYKDFDYIYKKATEELGMVEAAKDQINHYKSSENEYLIQNGDIPEE